MADKVLDMLESYVMQNKKTLISRLQDFLRHKSISTQNIGMEECADFLNDSMQKVGIKTKILRRNGAFPAVYGEILNSSAEKTLLIYGHYDVQPPEPMELWETDPFDPQIRDGKIYARGATDDKGNLWATVMAVQSLVECRIDIPINLKFLFEGEEEIGSPNFKAYIEENRDLLDADYTILCDRGIHESGRPQMYLGHKGIMNAEIKLKAAKRDVHSGQAPLVPNAAWQMVWLLNKLKNERDEILIPGYYENTVQPSEEDLTLLRDVPFNREEYCSTYGIWDIIQRNDGIEALIDLLFRPTATINGLTSGYQEPGNKTIVPSEASAKLDFRFVKNQNPEHCAEMVRHFLQQHSTGEIEIKFGDIRNPSKVSPKAEIVKVSIDSSKAVYGNDPVVWPMLDGSGPMALFGEILNAPAIIVGLGAPFAYANTHAPNENISINNYLDGIKLMAFIYYKYGKKEFH